MKKKKKKKKMEHTHTLSRATNIAKILSPHSPLCVFKHYDVLIDEIGDASKAF